MLPILVLLLRFWPFPRPTNCLFRIPVHYRTDAMTVVDVLTGVNSTDPSSLFRSATSRPGTVNITAICELAAVGFPAAEHVLGEFYFYGLAPTRESVTGRHALQARGGQRLW
jgi:hypothetical protein